MKLKPILSTRGLKQTSAAALVTAITAFAASNTFAAQYRWAGTTDTTWATVSNWTTTGATGLTLGPAPTGGSFTHRLSVNNTNANSATYNFPGVTTTYAADVASGSRGLVVGSGSNGSMIISAGTFSTLGAVSQDVIGNGTGFTGTLTIDGTAVAGAAQYIGTALGTDLGLGFGATSNLNIKNGTATVALLRTNNTTGTITIETGGILAMNGVSNLGGGNTIFNLDGGTLQARVSSTTFISTPTSGNSTVNVRSGGAIVNTDGFNITIARPLLQAGTSTGGGITKNGLGTLTLGAVSTTTGPAVVNAGGLVVPAGGASWQPSSFTHSGSALGFNIGVFSPTNAAPIRTGNASFTTPVSVSVTGSQFIVGQIPLLAYTGTLTGFSNLTLNTAALPAGVVATLQDNGAGLISLNVTQGGFVWSGETTSPGSGNWDTTSLAWNNFTSVYSPAAPVTFPNITGGGTVNITANFSPVSIDFTNNGANSYVLTGTGRITGAAAVNKTGTGTVELNNTNDYTGNTTVTNGILSIASTAALPGWNANDRYPISSGATLAVQNTVTDANISTMLGTTGNFSVGANIGFDVSAGDRTFSGNLTGTIGVTLVGFNNLTLAGTNSFTGSVRVPSGTLFAGSSTAFTGTAPLALSGTGRFDLNGFNAAFSSVATATTGNIITTSGTGTGTDTLTINGGTTSFSGIIEDGPSRKVAVRASGNNASTVPNNANNTYSGGLTLLGAIAPATAGTRLLPFASTPVVDGDGNVIFGPYGTGPITIGEAATDSVQIYFQAANRIIANPLIVNSALGTDTPGSFRVESIGHTIAGPIIANSASAFFRNHTTGGSAGVGAITLTGPISTGVNPAAGLTVNAAGANALTVTLNNQSLTPNSYTGDTVLTGANTTLLLGSADQIPNGTGKGNVVMTTARLDLAGNSETINGLGGSGNVDNFSTGTSNILTLGDGDATGTVFSGTITNTNGVLSLVKIGSGTQTLSGTASHTGTTLVRSGRLHVTGNIPSSPVTVGGPSAIGSPTLSGSTGSIAGNVSIAASGVINPGTPGTTGTINVGNLSISGTYGCDLISDAADRLNITGNLNLSGAQLTLNATTPVAGTYTIATYSGTLTGTFTPSPSLPAGTSISYSTPGEVRLIVGTASGFGSWTTSNNVTEGPNGDDDKDGISNLMEYALGLNPKTANAAPGSFIGNVLSFTKGSEAKAAGDVTYVIETSSTLAAGSWTPAAATDTADSISFTLPANQPGGKLFARLRIVMP